MTRLVAEKKCDRCGGLLVPPEMTPEGRSREVDYVCLGCRERFRWEGNPPVLVRVKCDD